MLFYYSKSLIYMETFFKFCYNIMDSDRSTGSFHQAGE